MSDESPQSSSGGVAFFATLLGCALFLGVLWFAYVRQFPRTTLGDGVHTTAQREAILQKLQDNEQTLSTTYGWVGGDKSKGVVRLPLARAMELTATELGAAQK